MKNRKKGNCMKLKGIALILSLISSSCVLGLIEPGVATLKDDLVVENDGTEIGWFSVGPTYAHYAGARTTIGIRNEANKKMFFLWGPMTRMQQLFKGKAHMSCWLCSGSGAKDPNRGDVCADRSEKNYCMECMQQVPCNAVIALLDAHSGEGEQHRENVGSFVSGLITKLDLLAPAPKEVQPAIALAK